jgi:hypothetical protein
MTDNEQTSDLRPADFATVAQRILARRPTSPNPRPSSEEQIRRDIVAARHGFLTGADRGNRPRVAGVTDKVIRLVCEAVGKAPVVGDHKGTLLAAKRAEAFVADRRLSTLVLTGLPGLGKSTAAAWVLAEAQHGAWLCAGDVRNDPEWHQRRKAMHDGYLVIVDDLGCETTPFATGELATLLERRHDAGKRTVVTTNLLVRASDRERIPAELKPRFPVGHSISERYGDRVASRLSDDRTLIGWLGGDDLRKATR